MNVKRFVGKSRRGLDVVKLKAKASYSQAGEDMIVDYLFNASNIKMPSYLEIGTNQPLLCNNTYFFYNKGCKGVCVEPDASMCKIIKKERPKDVVLNIGIGLTDTTSSPFYLFPGNLNSWSTFSEQEAIIRQKESGIAYKEVNVPLKTINQIIEQYFNPHPNFISLDVEGIDLDILKSLDFDRFKPEVFCVETISFSTNNSEIKLYDIIEFMESKNYVVYGDTHINTIFCRGDIFNHGR